MGEEMEVAGVEKVLEGQEKEDLETRKEMVMILSQMAVMVVVPLQCGHET